MNSARRWKELACPEEGIDLAEGALLIAADEYRGLDVRRYLARLEEMGTALKRRLRSDISATEALIALNRYVFDELGFSGNSDDYYDPRNSFLNDVIDRRLGIPITLSVVYIEIGTRVGLALQGVSFPAHFLVKCAVRDSPGFDLYDGRCESPSLRQKTQEITDERVPESESHEMGLQIPRRIHPEETEAGDLRGVATAPRGGISGAGAAQGVGGGGRASDARSRAHVHQHSAEVCGVQCGGVHEGQERDHDRAAVRGRTSNFTGEVFWARGYFVSTVGLDEEMVRAYIRHQEDEDARFDQMKLGV